MHLANARYVSLKGINSKTAAFREIAKALGVAASYARKASEMQARIEDVLERSKLMLVIDEAHWLFNQSARIYTRPELIDWVVTALLNRNVPVALVTTPQFLDCMARAIDQVEWNHRQFLRRVARRVVLPAKNSSKDVEMVARAIFPTAGNDIIKRMLGYVRLSKRDLSALGDIERELRFVLQPSDPGAVDLATAHLTFEQVEQVIDSHLAQTDVSFARDLADVMEKLKSRTLSPRTLSEAREPVREPVQERGADVESDIGFRALPPRDNGNRMRFRQPEPALAGVSD